MTRPPLSAREAALVISDQVPAESVGYRKLPGDAERLADVTLRDWLCWCWPHQDPQPVSDRAAKTRR